MYNKDHPSFGGKKNKTEKLANKKLANKKLADALKKNIARRKLSQKVSWKINFK